MTVPVIITDGGRADAGMGTRQVGDCVVRSIAVAAELPYATVHAELTQRTAHFLATARRTARQRQREKHLRKGVDFGVFPQVYKPYLVELGFTWTPTMTVGSGTQVHVRADELPRTGRHILTLSRHMSAYVDGTVHDNHDPARNGTRCVYGFWTKGQAA